MRTIKHIFSLLLLLIGWGSMYGQVLQVTADPSAYKTLTAANTGVDHVYLFTSADYFEFATIGYQLADWYDVGTGALVSHNYSTFINAESGHTYRVEVGAESETFAVIDWSKYRLANCTLRIEPACDKTYIFVDNIGIALYYDTVGGKHTIERQLMLEYKNAVWNDESVDWLTQEQSDTLTGDVSASEIGKLLIDSDFKLSDATPDAPFEEDTLYAQGVVAIASACHLTHVTTRRGTEITNEKEAPIKEDVVEGSAPLDIFFQSHPSPKTDYYDWTISRGSDKITQRPERDIRYLFDDASETGPVTYTVELKVGNSTCQDSAKIDVTLNASFIMVPNVFTPNGDGMNDEFRVAYRSICSFHCWVFNRWQHQVYSWSDPAKGWNGTINGRPAPESAYVYIVEATGCDGKKYKLKGMVNLLRGK
ncbi:MAG: gliding motility-associated C-terminal domain-containing protein [Paludibacteraceae bacterium]|nr:gliding motility-associated C-terminal domain-containing protein [Paludibacteraceae bacterium]